jgi:hypothetical protein
MSDPIRKDGALNDAAIDKAALATLRPGMPLSSLATVCGPDWNNVKPAQDGWIVKLVDIGFTARVDIDGVIGKVGFSGKFPDTILVEGLRLGMSFEDALAAYPSLRHIEDVTVSMMTLRRFKATRSDGITIELRFRDGRLLAFDLERTGAVYGSSV